MLLLAHLIRQHHTWERSQIRLMRIIDSAGGVEQTKASMEQVLKKARVEAEPIVLVRKNPAQPLFELMIEASREADLTLLGVQLPEAKNLETYSQRLDALLAGVGSVLLVRSGEVDPTLLQGGDG
jgi:hypothetical protein